VVRTSAPAWLFERTARRTVTILAGETDPGVVQLDALRLDERATVEQAAAFYAALPARAAREADVLRRHEARLVVTDVPPLACAAARRAGVPSVVCSNFTWDWIYQAYAAHGRDALRRVVAVIQDAYASADAGWRLPMHGGFESVGNIRDLPLVARRPRPDRTRESIRAALDLPAAGRIALASFGGVGVRSLPLDRLDCTPEWTVVVTAPDGVPARVPGVHPLSEDRIYGRGLLYEDLVRASDVVISKPGYGIVSDCVASDTALLYTSRGNFPEYEVLVGEMPRLLRCRFLKPGDFSAGRWKEGLEEVVSAAAPPVRPDVGGADVAARMIADYLD
jgi:L-arabinokinase